jgi:hypothetical protein
LASCGKCKAVEERIERLTAQQKIEAAELRAAQREAKYEPSDASDYFRMLFRAESEPLNLADSAQCFLFVVGKTIQESADSAPIDAAALRALRTKSEAYLQTTEELSRLQRHR